MGKKANENQVSEELFNGEEITTEVSPYVESKIDDAMGLIAEFSKAPETALQELTSTYLEPSPGLVINAVFVGMTTATFEGKEREVARLILETGEAKIYAGAVVVNSLKKLTNIPALVRICFTEKIKSAAGNYWGAKVLTLASNI